MLAEDATGDDVHPAGAGANEQGSYRRKQSWFGVLDMLGPARGRELKPPHRRHFLPLAGGRWTKKEVNTVVLPRYRDAVFQDIEQIAAGKSRFNHQTTRYEINGRSYGVEDSGMVFPDSGTGMVQMDRIQYGALLEIAKVRGDLSKAEPLRRDPKFSSAPEAIALALAVYNGTYERDVQPPADWPA